MFYGCKFKEIPQYNLSNVSNIYNAFGYNINLTKIPDLNTVAISPTTVIAEFCPNLIEVESLKFSEYADNEEIMFSPFPYCNNLTKIKFDSIIYRDIKWSHNPNLSDESLISMINALVDYSDTEHIGYISLY